MRNLTEENTTDIVLNAWSKNPDPRFKEIMDAMITHLHKFVREVRLTEDEWGAAIKYLHACADISSPERSEFILTSDVLGISSLVDTNNNRRPDGATENSVLGPFYISEAGELGEVPVIQNGDDLIGELNKDGVPSYVRGMVRDAAGNPIAGAALNFWQNAPNGLYDVQEPENGYNLSCRIMTGADGRFAFTMTKPLPYTIPLDGPVAVMMKRAKRNVWRPAHLHVRIEAAGYETLTTELFIDGDEYLDDDAVFGVKDSLVLKWELNDSAEDAEKVGIWAPFCDIENEIVLHPVASAEAAE